jgi:hypothetical protein
MGSVTTFQFRSVYKNNEQGIHDQTQLTAHNQPIQVTTGVQTSSSTRFEIHPKQMSPTTQIYLERRPGPSRGGDSLHASQRLAPLTHGEQKGNLTIPEIP